MLPILHITKYMLNQVQKKGSHNKFIYYHTGHPYVQVSRIVGVPSRRITLTCFCAECTSIKWWVNGQLISQNDYGVKDAKRKLGGVFIGVKYSSYGLAFYDRDLYSCSVTDTYGNETFQRKAHIKGICMLL